MVYYAHQHIRTGLEVAAKKRALTTVARVRSMGQNTSVYKVAMPTNSRSLVATVITYMLTANGVFLSCVKA